MSSHTRPKLTWVEISSLLGVLPLAAGTIVSFFCNKTWRHWREGNLSYKSFKRIAVAGFGTAISVLGPRQVRLFVSKTTSETITEYCASHDLSHEPVLVEKTDGFPPARLHFIDCKLEETGPILLYFHGGGYVVPLHSPAYALTAARSANCPLVLFEYTLAPECVYPGQLSQVIAALHLILSTGHRTLADIIIGGESAGGNMCLAILAHMQQPKPGIRPLLPPPPHSLYEKPPTRFRGMLAISPRTKNSAESGSFETNTGRDFMSRHSLNAISASWKPRDEVWAAPAMASEDFWNGLHADRVLMVAGGDEVYRDDITHTARMMGARDNEKGPVQLVICPGEIHCQASLDLAAGVRDGLMTKAVHSWTATLP